MLATDWLDRIKAETEYDSDNKIAMHWGVSRQAISKYRMREGSTFSDEVALKVAELLGIDPMEVIASQNLERAKTRKVKEFWGKKMVGGGFLKAYLRNLLISFGLFFLFLWWLGKLIGSKSTQAVIDVAHYILCQIGTVRINRVAECKVLGQRHILTC
jgi:hypothetical protein